MTTLTAQEQLNTLAAHLRLKRKDLLAAWREAIRRDPQLTISSKLSRSALDDHIPKILDDFERRLRAEHALDALQVDLEQRNDAAEHGRHRWRQGYDIRETLREWGHLQSILQKELERYAADHPDLEGEVMPMAREGLTELCTQGNCESASRHVRLEQTEAASRLRDLEVSLTALQALENDRAALVRETAHDLRGSVGVIANTTALLARSEVATPQRSRFYDLLQNRIDSMSALLTDLVELARLEAGQNPLKIEAFDAGQRLREHCELLRPLAAERNLFLRCEGPSPLPVESDPLKIQRILQNLLLNALKATQRGGVVVRWWMDAQGRPPHWKLSVEDTGPGFTLQATGPLRHALKRATEEGHRMEIEAAASGPGGSDPQRTVPPIAASGPGSAALPSGEGIGLSIVKRLCELLGATVELHTAPGHGTAVTVTLPLRYNTEQTTGG
ncbi:MAG TPA: sensor histidine kinase [Steroidobacteraceae bacterium]|nr:sensor histidine kinase [Steroidobacteraceae bacterium]